MNKPIEEMIKYLQGIFTNTEREFIGQYLYPVRPHHLLIRAKKVLGNMVFNHEGTILFNMVGTPQENGSYREVRKYNLEKPLSEQSGETISEIFNLVKEVEDAKSKENI